MIAQCNTLNRSRPSDRVLQPLLNVITATLMLVAGGMIFVGWGCSHMSDSYDLTGESVSSLLQILECAVRDRDSRMTATAVIELGLSAQGNDDVERVMTDAFRQARKWRLPAGVDWPDAIAELERRYPDPTTRPIDAVGSRNTTVGVLFLEAVDRIEARSGYRFTVPALGG